MSKPGCAVCGATDCKLLRCSQCKIACYCSKEHQRAHWKSVHKAECKKSTPSSSQTPAKFSKSSSGKRRGSKSKLPADDSPYTTEGSSENEILESEIEKLQETAGSSRTPEQKKPEEEQRKEEKEEAVEDEEENKEDIRGFSKISLEGPESPEKASILEEVSMSVVRDMDAYGVCVVDHFLGPEMGQEVLAEVVGMYKSGMFKDGQTVSATGSDVKNIRRDKIAWLNGTESHSKSISALITKVDTVVRQANKMLNNGKMGSYVINGRTKAMVACYPAQGSHYVKHVDNPNNDGRCITAIYYLNTNWNVEKDGGLLRIFPQGWEDQVANIEPLFDRIIFFWSDRRNPHEVQPSYRTRYAITLWYFDANEREEATRKHLLQRQLKMQNQQAISS